MKSSFTKMLCVFSALLFLTGCSVQDDPLENNPTSEAPSQYSTEISDSDAPDTTVSETPEVDFYSLTMAESYEKYGMLTFLSFALDNWYDGEKYYSLRYVTEDGTQTMYAPMTLKYRDYPDGNTWSPVCSDPLCTHTAGAGCKLAKCNNPFGFVCMAGKVFFVGSDSVLYLYDPSDNSAVALHDRIHEYKLYEQCGSLYVVYQIEDSEFNVKYAALKADPDGSVTELGTVNELCAIKESPVYADKYLIDTRIDKTYAELFLRDLISEKTTSVCKIEYTADTVIEPASASTVAVYEEKALLRIMYRTDKEHDDLYLVDLTDGQARLIASKVGIVQNWLYSDRCIIWMEKRNESADPFIIHILFPNTEEAHTYDISMLAEAEEFSIPIGAGLKEVKKGALLINCAYALENGKDDEGNAVYEMTMHDLLEFDIESGKLQVFSTPKLPEYSSLFN